MKPTEEWVATDTRGYVVLMMCVTGYSEAVKQLIASLGIRAMDKYYLRRFRTGDQIGIQNG